MLTRCRPIPATRARRAPSAFTLLETTLVLVLVGLVLGLVIAIGTRLQRQLNESRWRIESFEQLSVAATLLPLDLRGLSPPDGDIRAGEARDSSLELRSTLATGIVCGVASNTLTIVPFLLAGGRRFAANVQAGDTLWLLADGDSTERWQPFPTRTVRAASGSCPAVAAESARPVFDVDHLVGMELPDSADVVAVAGTMARITRPIRYSIYKSGDGAFYLGVRTWNTAAAQWNTIQPLSGPYAPPGPRGTHIDYFDANGNSVPSGSLNTGEIARIEWITRGEARAGFPPGDSARVVVAVRNRR